MKKIVPKYQNLLFNLYIYKYAITKQNKFISLKNF
jgi:hypothetical protein